MDENVIYTTRFLKKKISSLLIVVAVIVEWVCSDW